MKQALEVMDPFTIVWYRFITAAIGLGVILFWKKKLPTWRQITALSGLLLIIASIGLAGNFVLYNTSLKYLTPSVVQVIIQLAPIILLVTSAWLFKEKLTLHQIIGVVVLLVGLVLFFNEKLIELVAGLSSYTLGVVLAVCAALVWVVYGLAQKRLLRHFSSVQILFMIYVICAVFLTPMATPSQLSMMDMRQWGMLAFCCLNTLIGYGAFAEAMARWKASQVSALITLTPLFTIVFVDLASMGWPEFVSPVSLNFMGYIGAIVVVSGAMFCAIGHRWVRAKA